MKFTCDCGNTFRLSDMPSRDEFQILGDAEKSDMIRQIMLVFGDKKSPEEFFYAVDDIFFGLPAIKKQLDGIECPKCRRLTVISGNKTKFTYRRDDTKGESLYDALVELNPTIDRRG